MTAKGAADAQLFRGRVFSEGPRILNCWGTAGGVANTRSGAAWGLTMGAGGREEGGGGRHGQRCSGQVKRKNKNETEKKNLEEWEKRRSWGKKCSAVIPGESQKV